MTRETKTLVRYRLARAREALQEARLLYDAGHLATAVNRAYYACFYVVSALLLSEGYVATKHAGVRALFDQHWVKAGRVSKDWGRFYRRMFDRRQEGDYDDLVSFAPDGVVQWLREADGFVAELSSLLAEKHDEPDREA